MATAQLVDELVVGVDRSPIDGQDVVALLHANLFGRGAGYDAVDFGGQQWAHERRVGFQHAQQVEVARQRDAHVLAVADDVDALGL